MGVGPRLRRPGPIEVVGRNAVEKRTCVRMLRPLENLFHGALFDDLAILHDQNAGTEVSNDRKIMRDQYEADAKLILQIEQEIQDLSLHRHVEAGHDFVGYKQARRYAEGPGDIDPLFLSTRELCRKAINDVGREPGFSQKLTGARGSFSHGRATVGGFHALRD